MAEYGQIMRALSGFYDVDTGTGIVRCRARGKFRRAGISPLVGDRVAFSRTGDEGVLEEVLPRKNRFVRPAVANLDCLVMLASAVNPVTDPFLIDRVSVIAAEQGAETILCLNKCDLNPADALYAIYADTGIRVLRTSAVTGAGIEELRAAISEKLVAFTGNSGVGKSSVLNRLFPGAEIPTGAVSDKLGRGKHTTRHVELYQIGDGTRVIDTPGFSAFDTAQMELGSAAELQYAFPEFAPYLGKCRFDDCAHVAEQGCAVLAALAAGKIQRSRHESYVRLYDQRKEIKAWQQKKD